MDRVPVGVAVVIRDHANKILFMRRQGKHGSGTWAVPGGWVEPGEGPINTCKREAIEEVGVELFNLELLGFTHDIFDEGIEDICLWFLSDSWTGMPSICEPTKATELKWLTVVEFEQIPTEFVFGGHERMNLRAMLEGR